MPETPDFDQIARACFGDDPITIPANTLKVGQTIRLTGTVPDAPLVARLAEALRQVWNARGAADLEALEPILGANMDHEIRAIQRLDR